ncbi:unnamed protein product, partial [Ectocarpus fasciculatus]
GAVPATRPRGGGDGGACPLRGRGPITRRPQRTGGIPERATVHPIQHPRRDRRGGDLRPAAAAGRGPHRLRRRRGPVRGPLELPELP